jgi:hypothetical protein
MHHREAGPTGRLPVQPSTPLGPDQVNVLLLLGRNVRQTVKGQCNAPADRGVWGDAVRSMRVRRTAKLHREVTLMPDPFDAH